jgi:hypothetical protein
MGVERMSSMDALDKILADYERMEDDFVLCRTCEETAEIAKEIESLRKRVEDKEAWMKNLLEINGYPEYEGQNYEQFIENIAAGSRAFKTLADKGE